MLRGLVVCIILASVSLPAGAQVSGAPMFMGPDGGQKQIGPVTWVWRTRQFQPIDGPFQFKAPCPTGDVVMGGGYRMNSLQTLNVSDNRPGNAFEGWIIGIQQMGVTGTVKITVYAACTAAH